MATVLIEGTEYTLTPEKTQELLQWLSTNGAVRVEANTGQEFDGNELLNETGRGSVNKPATQHDPPRETDPDKTWDFGTKWF